MPEGDTVWRTARRLHQALAGGVVTLSDLRFPDVATADLRGATTVEVVSRGKHILHRFDSGLTLHSHLRMEGQWRIEAAHVSARWLQRPDLRAAVGTNAWTALGLRLGMLDLLQTADEGTLVGHLGPDILGADWDAARAAANVRDSGQPVGEALMDQRHLAGVGTMWAAETLFLERVNPWTVAGSLPPETVAAIVERAHRLMTPAIHHAMQSSTGIRRQGENTYAHGRSGRPCRRCGDGIRVAFIGTAPRERTMFYCPTCQGGLAPTDDGRAQRPLGASGPKPGAYRRTR